ncbi:MAG: SRPBCC family protein [Gemmatimonadales bacterium]|nr:SRPBCC family protein [Gemmatimonadales bacterium]
MLPLHHETTAVVPAPVETVFAHVDDHTRLSSHMNQRSWRMGGARMTMTLDDGLGRQVGSRIRLGGEVLGIELGVEEVVTERTAPYRKAWETTGSPKLLVIGHYRMGFEITAKPPGSMLRVFIDYTLPEGAPARWLGVLFGRFYARWCTRRMVDDVVRQFGPGT